MDMDIFNLGDVPNITDYDNSTETKFTPEEYVIKTKAFLQKLLDGYGQCWKRIPEDDLEDCPRCGGFGIIEQGGDGDVTCPSCNGTCVKIESVFDTEEFSTFVEDLMFNNSKYNMFDLLCFDIENLEKTE